MSAIAHITRAEMDRLRRDGRVTTETGLSLEVVG